MYLEEKLLGYMTTLAYYYCFNFVIILELSLKIAIDTLRTCFY